MANTVNLTAESGANFIGDDTGTALEIENSSTGIALHVKSGTGVATKVEGTASASAPLEVYSGKSTTIGAVTVAPLKLIASGVSAAILEVSGGSFISVTSVNNAFAVLRIKKANSYYYIPVISTVDGATAV